MKILFIGSRLYDDIDYYVRENGIESIITESNEDAINLDLPDQVFIVPRGMDSPKQIAISQNVDAVVPLIGIDPPLIEVAKMKEELEAETDIPVIAANVRAVRLTSDKIKTKEFYNEIGVPTPQYQILAKDDFESKLKMEFPVVLKQGQGQGGKDIKVAESLDDVKEYFEKFIEGSEISIEVLGYNGEYVPLSPIYKGETTLEGIHPLNKIKTAPCLVEGLDNNLVQRTAYKVAKNLGSDGIFVGSGIFKSNNPEAFAKAIVEATANYDKPEVLAEVSKGLGEAMKGLEMSTLSEADRMQDRGI